MTDPAAAPAPPGAPRLLGLDTALYLVTDSAMCRAAGRSVAQTVALAVEGGAGLVQVRDKHAGEAEFDELARSVVAAVEQTRDRLGIDHEIPVFLDDRVASARRLLDEGLRVHVHVGQDDEPVERVSAAIGPEPLLGLSASNEQEFAAGEAAGGVDLFGVGPVWATQTKDVARAALGPERIRELAAAARLPIVAIGGIGADNAAELAGSGAIGVCVVSAICAAPDPRAAAQRIRAAFAETPHLDDPAHLDEPSDPPAPHPAGGTP
ncbi:thiamine phosphate synthase [Brevibacterium sp. BRM-1]|uniref:thiamine phosphate synthase n=1 Tax=Brevibacterium sp. BRM-1 TaxID=2999062 RepID=UPI00227DBAE8|nr:thiamine phosphate synthase [Brevibacterium sp. BRM-1]WAL40138.1 thiamine phosphate synthase [Brevibacterium sp. BRM-1]